MSTLIKKFKSLPRSQLGFALPMTLVLTIMAGLFIVPIALALAVSRINLTLVHNFKK